MMVQQFVCFSDGTIKTFENAGKKVQRNQQINKFYPAKLSCQWNQPSPTEHVIKKTAAL